MTKKNLPTNFKERNSNRSNRRSLIGLRRTANLLPSTSVKKCRVDIHKLNFNKASNFQIFPKDVTKTGNGEWGMGNGEWGMGNGEWGMGIVYHSLI